MRLYTEKKLSKNAYTADLLSVRFYGDITDGKSGSVLTL
jgi:hypothetical protein